jgi:hypothetical protein
MAVNPVHEETIIPFEAIVCGHHPTVTPVKTEPTDVVGMSQIPVTVGVPTRIRDVVRTAPKIEPQRFEIKREDLDELHVFATDGVIHQFFEELGPLSLMHAAARDYYLLTKLLLYPRR